MPQRNSWYLPGLPKGHPDPWGYLGNRQEARYWLKRRNQPKDDFYISDIMYGSRTWVWKPSQRKAKPTESEARPTQESIKKDEPFKPDSDPKLPKHRPLYVWSSPDYTYEPSYPEKWIWSHVYPNVSSTDPRTNITGSAQLLAGSWVIHLENTSLMYPCSIQTIIFWTNGRLIDIGTPGDYYRNITKDGVQFTSYRTLRNPAYIMDPDFQTIYYDKATLLPASDHSGKNAITYKITRDLTGLFQKVRQFTGDTYVKRGFIGIGFMAKQYLPGDVTQETHFYKLSANLRLQYTSDTLNMVAASI